MKTNLKKLPKSEIEIEFELTEEEFKEHLSHALEHLKSHIKVDGFRQGKVPENIIKERVGKENLLMEAGDHAVNHEYRDFIKENNLEPVGQPEVSILKIAEGSPFLFKIKVAVMPEIELPDYKEIASRIKGKEISVETQEIEDALNYLQKSRAKFTTEDRPAEKKDFVEIVYQNEQINQGKEIGDRFVLGEGGFMKDFEDNILGMKAGEEKEFTAKFPENSPRKDLAGKNSKFKVRMKAVQKMELPEINDEFAKSLGAFESLITLKDNLKEGIKLEKSEAEKQRKRTEILDKISEKVKFEIPEKMQEYEQQRLLENFKNRVQKTFSAQGGPASGWEQYLVSIKKTEEEIKKSFEKEAEKRLKEFLVLRQVGKNEKVEASEAEINEEVARVIKNYSKEQLGKIDIDELKEYTKGVIINEKIFKFLECQ